jgi:Na+-transporting NADH:ubiquinone oxidoreductase subunit NqrF
LVSQGDVEILLNDDESKKIIVKPGSSLLSSLASSGIFLPYL